MHMIFHQFHNSLLKEKQQWRLISIWNKRKRFCNQITRSSNFSNDVVKVLHFNDIFDPTSYNFPLVCFFFFITHTVVLRSLCSQFTSGTLRGSSEKSSGNVWWPTKVYKLILFRKVNTFFFSYFYWWLGDIAHLTILVVKTIGSVSSETVVPVAPNQAPNV